MRRALKLLWHQLNTPFSGSFNFAGAGYDFAIIKGSSDVDQQAGSASPGGAFRFIPEAVRGRIESMLARVSALSQEK